MIKVPPQAVYNTSEEAIPPFAAMEIADHMYRDGVRVYCVCKPRRTGLAAAKILFNGPSEIPPERQGTGFTPYHAEARAAASGESFGTVEASWFIGAGSDFDLVTPAGERVIVSAAPRGSTSTTTTTFVPDAGPLPGVPCKWLANGDLQWELDSGSPCLSATTTTTSDPCRCPTTTTTPAPGGPSTTTTTPAPEYDCAYPTFCPTEAGQCTFTACAKIGEESPPPVECTTTAAPTTTTTTTLDPETTTTTFDCNSTTTPDPGACNDTCVWVGDPVSGQPVLVSGCGSVTNCAGQNICGSCPPPAGPLAACDSTTTDCVAPGPPTQPGPPPACGGGHSYICGIDNQWHYVGGSCSGYGSCQGCADCLGIFGWNTSDCVAGQAPTGPCQCGASTTVGCRPAPCTGCSPSSPGYEPCAGTTVMPTTTTTPDACGTNCLWEKSGGAWTNTSNGCLGECNCNYPAYAPQPDDCPEVASTPCLMIEAPGTTTTPVPTTTTTTTLPPTTTTTTLAPTTTTTTPNPFYCVSAPEDESCSSPSCLQLSEEELFSYNYCGGPFTGDCSESPICSPTSTTTTTPAPTTTTTTLPPTTTTTTPAPYYCCGPSGGSCFDAVSCIQGQPCESNEPSLPGCGGAYATLEDCVAACASQTTTTTTTCDPNYPCTANSCVMQCPNVPGSVWQPWVQFLDNDRCQCCPSQTDWDLVGTPCDPFAETGRAVPMCNPCPGADPGCSGCLQTTTTTPAP
jgi:hypothetical protein